MKTDPADLLGMPKGRAAHLLRREVVFHLITELGLDGCPRCHKPLLSSDNMSLDHIEPWLDVDPGLFWNLDNVGFSHRFCNASTQRASTYGDPNRGSQQLGMNKGTATGRLRQMLMFRLSQMAAMDICCRCQKIIAKATDLTIDHLDPWRLNPGQYWDMSRIAFAHPICNTLAANRSVPHDNSGLRRAGPQGTSWCAVCGEFRDVSLFTKNSNRWSGLDSWCRECRSSKRS